MSAGGRNTGRETGRLLLSVVCGVRCSTVLTSWAIVCTPRLKSRSTDLDLLWPVCFQTMQFDFQDAIVETSLDLVGIDPEWQLNCARKRAVSALASLPIGILLLLGASCPLQGQHVFLQADRDIVARHAGQLTSHHHAVVAEPD